MIFKVLLWFFRVRNSLRDQFYNNLKKEFVQNVSAKYAVAFCNGTAALHCAYYAAGIGNDDEIITTPVTFAATTNAALNLDNKSYKNTLSSPPSLNMRAVFLL
jgi:dTDP-4-amino-4,6-dideoxygalactose transaminase